MVCNPNYHPNTQAVKVDYSLAGDWVAQTALAPPLNSPPVLLLYVLVIVVQFSVAQETGLTTAWIKIQLRQDAFFYTSFLTTFI